MSDLTSAINGLQNTLDIECDPLDNSTHTGTCHFKQDTLNSLFGQGGLTLDGCIFGECIQQNVLDNGGNLTDTSPEVGGGAELSGGVIAGLAVVGGLIFLALGFLFWGLRNQHTARKAKFDEKVGSGLGVEWNDVTYVIPSAKGSTVGETFTGVLGRMAGRAAAHQNDDKVILDSVTGSVRPGQMMAILGPSGELSTFIIPHDGTQVSRRCWENYPCRDYGRKE